MPSLDDPSPPITPDAAAADDEGRNPPTAAVHQHGRACYRPAPAFPPDASGALLPVLVWMLETPRFAFEDMVAAFPGLAPGDLRGLLDAGLATGAFVPF